MLWRLWLLSVIAVASQSAFGSQAPGTPASKSAQTSARPSKEAASTPDRPVPTSEQQRLENLIRVRGFADHIQEFKSLTARVRGLIGLANVLWKQDEPYARKLFTMAYEAARSNPEAERTDNHGGGGADSTTPDYGWLRREVAAAIARHDPAWAKSLTAKEADTSKSSNAYFEMAGALVGDDPRQARQFIEMGLNAGPDANIYPLLTVLRLKDPAAADALFLRSLEELAAQPRVDASQLIWLGYYVMALDPGVTFIQWGRRIIFNLAGVNPSASPGSITAYLDTAVDILSRPVTSSPDSTFTKEENYLAGCVLLSSIRQFTPERAPQLEATMRNLAADLSSDLTEDAVRARIDAVRPAIVNTLEEARKDVDGIQDDARRELRCIDLSHAFYLKGNFLAAKAIAGEVKDLQTRDKLSVLLGFEEGARLAEQGKLNQAIALATKLSPGIERAVLWLAVAHKQIERGDTKLAGTTINWALTDANRLRDPRRAVLILRAAADLAGFDPPMASQTLTEAVRTINSVSPYSPLKMQWSEQASPRQPQLTFPLQMGGLDFQLARMLAPLAKADLEGTIDDVMTLDDEEARGKGLAILASLILERKPGNK